MRKNWSMYKDAARTVLNELREALRSATPEGRRQLEGAGGDQWEIEAKVGQDAAGGFLVVDVRQYSSPLHQEAQVARAWRIEGAGGDPIVAIPLSLQSEAAASVQKAGNEYLRLTDDSTAENYLAEFLSRRFQGASPA